MRVRVGAWATVATVVATLLSCVGCGLVIDVGRLHGAMLGEGGAKPTTATATTATGGGEGGGEGKRWPSFDDAGDPASPGKHAPTLPPSDANRCRDHAKDGDETDVDCGGSCAPCPNLEHCSVNADCLSGACSQEQCVPCDAVSGADPCDPDRHCDPEAKSCVYDHVVGHACHADGDCATGHCVDAVCCDSGCNAGCGRCAFARGAPKDGACATVTATFRAVLTNVVEPTVPGDGFTGAWSYDAAVGIAAANAACHAIGGDHACTYPEVRAADLAGELVSLPKGLTYWLVRATPAPDPALAGVSCQKNADCVSGAYDVCDTATSTCSYAFGLGNSCASHTLAGGSDVSGEWFSVYGDGAATNEGGVHDGSLVFHFGRKGSYVVAQPQPCQDEKVLGCAGSCAAKRALLCCNPACP